ncbi:MAG: membrane protein insertion efficiency factor YidD [Candidatus Yanofskybacteria bacterium RIFCSPLOWO2_01_FULL_41_34]|uniref:Putative membrane protein insertion efficiency factor n=1 Tax=Candidatus Yanofskybacteria bacterium RIFCSPHIGHO2_01_FULL_41_26 TaxID=1802661 RepID=A0A1F8EE05_9BACT|nr:MAG: membrane protein insertion efficiency factor YidD [Candidatus Yanofskybacteria bacterium RIFCSPHIGHO2_01_FULL_41_26]OGN21658.1 MAG: membrane protein insertion efficiency factor YidD [Candidatus Yanofskybacteria bacterium RIFCSPLOWO2_01_FULL_41_34]
MTTKIIKLIKLYKKTISPIWTSSPFGFFYSSCRFYPTCSDYAVDAVSKYGVVRGTFKAVCRVLRCNPLAKAGIDEA